MSDSISGFSGFTGFDYQVQSMQAQLNQLTSEISSGQKSNAAASMGSNAALLYQLHFQADQQTAVQTSVNMASQSLDTVQTALTSVSSVAQTMATASLNSNSGTASGFSVVAGQAKDAMAQVLGDLNTSFAGAAVFAGDASAAPPMQAADAAGGPLATVNAVLSAAVSTKGGALSQTDVAGLLNGANGLSSVFDDSNSNPAQRYSGAFYTATDDGKSTKVMIGATQTLQYNAKANQPAFRDLLKGLSMLSMLDAPSSQLDDTAKSTLLSQANTVIGKAQNELTSLQGSLGATQAQLKSVADDQQAAASATQLQITSYEQADTYGDATKLSALQTQLQATYELTAQISQLSLTHYMPTPA